MLEKVQEILQSYTELPTSEITLETDLVKEIGRASCRERV